MVPTGTPDSAPARSHSSYRTAQFGEPGYLRECSRAWLTDVGETAFYVSLELGTELLVGIPCEATTAGPLLRTPGKTFRESAWGGISTHPARHHVGNIEISGVWAIRSIVPRSHYVVAEIFASSSWTKLPFTAAIASSTWRRSVSSVVIVVCDCGSVRTKITL